MREIKFRIFVQGKFLYFELWAASQVITSLLSANQFFSEEIKKIMESVQQFTGLKDKSGKEIYEGDILHLQKDAMTKPPFVWDNINKNVTYENGMFMVGGRTVYQSSTLYKYDFRVIGNIYENPELL